MRTVGHRTHGGLCEEINGRYAPKLGSANEGGEVLDRPKGSWGTVKSGSHHRPCNE